MGSRLSSLGWLAGLVAGRDRRRTRAAWQGVAQCEACRSETAAALAERLEQVAQEHAGRVEAGADTGRIERLRALADAASDGLLLADLGGRLVEVNARCRALLGLEPSLAGDGERGGGWLTDSEGPMLSSIVEGEKLGADLAALLARPEASGKGQVTLRRDGVPIAWSSRPARNPAGQVIGRLLVLRDARADRSIEELKTDFISTVSHELRTPLTSIRGSLELVLRGTSALGSGERELLEISHKNTERLIRLINDILDISRLELGRLDLDQTTFDLPPLIANAVAAVRVLASARGVAVAEELAAGLPRVHADRERLLQVLVNLLDNAIKYSAPGGMVMVRAVPSQEGVQVDVRDWGPGIPAGQHGLLFRRFSRLASPPGQGSGGAGLGLAISRAIIERLGGRIWVESAPGKGSTFSFSLPPSIYREVVPAGGAVGEGDEPAGGRVLLIEDDDDARTVVAATLEAAGFEVTAVGSGLEGIGVARRGRFDAALLDLVLPDLGGYDVLRLLKSRADTARIPVVLLTVQPEVTLARALGACEVLCKPAEGTDVVAAVRRAMSAGAGRGRRLRVLVGSPASRAASTVARLLTEAGHTVVRAGSRARLTQLACEQLPELIVLDEDFEPDDPLGSVARHPPTCTVPLVVLSSRPAGPPPRSGVALLAKPVSPADLQSVLEDLVAVPQAQVAAEAHSPAA